MEQRIRLKKWLLVPLKFQHFFYIYTFPFLPIVAIFTPTPNNLISLFLFIYFFIFCFFLNNFILFQVFILFSFSHRFYLFLFFEFFKIYTYLFFLSTYGLHCFFISFIVNCFVFFVSFPSHLSSSSRSSCQIGTTMTICFLSNRLLKPGFRESLPLPTQSDFSSH